MPIYFNNNKVGAALELKNLQEKTVTENNVTVTPDPGYNGLSSVDVNIVTGDYNIDQIIDGDECELVITTAKGKEIVIDLPEEFASVPNISHIVLDDVILISSYGQGTASVGVWIYNINDEALIQGYKSYNFTMFQELPNGDCLIGGGSPALLLYEKSTNTIKYISNITTLTGTIIPFDNDCLVLTGRGSFYIYDYYSKETSLLYSTENTNNATVYSYVVTKKVLVNYNNADKGIYLFNDETKDVSKLHDLGYYTIFTPVKSGVILTGNSSASKGVMLFDLNTLTCDYVYSEGNTFMNVLRIPSGLIISAQSTASTSLGILYFNETNNECVRIFTEGYSYTVNAVETSIGIFINGQLPIRRCLFYDFSTRETRLLFSNIYQYISEIDEGILISSSESGAYGLYFLAKTSKELSKIYDSGLRWNVVIKVQDGYLITSTLSGFGLLFVDNATLEVTLLDSGGPRNTYIKVQGGYLFIATSITFYSEEMKTNTRLTLNGTSFSEAKGLDQYIIKDNVVVIYGSDKSIQPRIVEYNQSTGVLKLVKYYIEKV